MANARWERERQRAAALAEVEARDPLRAPGRIVRRIIRYGYDSVRSWRRKLRSVGLSTSERELPEH